MVYQIDFVAFAGLMSDSIISNGFLVGIKMDHNLILGFVSLGKITNIASNEPLPPRIYNDLYIMRQLNYELLQWRSQVFKNVGIGKLKSSIYGIGTPIFQLVSLLTNQGIAEFKKDMTAIQWQAEHLIFRGNVESYYGLLESVHLEYMGFYQEYSHVERLLAMAKDYQDQPGYVYALPARDNGREVYKIGKTKDPKSRAKTFNVELPYSSEIEFSVLIPTPSYTRTERMIQETLRQLDYGLDGEWFDIDHRILDQLKELETIATASNTKEINQ